MVTPRIGLFAVTAMKERIRPAHRKIATIPTAPGVDGSGLVAAGWAAEVQRIPTCTQVASETAALALMESYRKLEGTIQTIIDQFNVTWSNVAILGAVSVPADVGYAGFWRIDTLWTILPDTVRPAGL